MATKKQIRMYAEANGISREAARQHFINEAKNRKEKMFENLPKDYTSYTISIDGVVNSKDQFAVPNDRPFALPNDSSTFTNLPDMVQHTKESLPFVTDDQANILALASWAGQIVASGLFDKLNEKAAACFFAEVTRRVVEPIVGKFKSIEIQITAFDSPAKMLGMLDDADPCIAAFTDDSYVRIRDFNDNIVFEITTHDIVADGDNGMDVTASNISKYLDELLG